MCGIFGYSGTRDVKIDRVLIDNLEHRGPDAQVVETHGDWRLGHLRLSIIDTSAAANQPMTFGEDTFIFNGEIYNYVELRAKYLKGIKLKTSSDTEVLFRLLQKFGLKILNELNGMFAFAWYNGKSKKLMLVRDRFGVKPLYWTSYGSRFFFASETKPLVKIRGSVSLSRKAIDLFLKETVTDQGERSFIDNVFQVLPGHFVEVRNGVVHQRQRWYRFNDFEFDKSIFDNHDKTVVFFEDLLTNAIALRHRSDVPVAITLSGGLDSTTIYTLAKEKFKSKAQPITYSHGKSKTDETHLVSRLTKTYNETTIKVRATEKQSISLLKKVLKYLEFPIWNNSATAFWETYEKIHSLGFKVIIEGHGSDELLGGYPYMVGAAWQELFCTGKIFKAYQIYRVYTETLNSDLNQTTKKLNNFFSFFFYTLLRERFNISRNMKGLFERTIRRAFDRDIIPVVLRTFDRLTMAHSIESRSPFMDYRIVEFCRAMPLRYKVNSFGNKAILREILKKYGKDYIYENKRKMGFAADIPSFYNNRENRKKIKKIVFSTSNNYGDIAGRARRSLNKKVIDWIGVEPIWKILSLELTKKIYATK